MKIVADTNVLLRDALNDDPRQSPIAGKVLQSAELVAVPVAVLCEFVWVLCQGYNMSALEVANSIRSLIDSWNVVTNKANKRACCLEDKAEMTNPTVSEKEIDAALEAQPAFQFAIASTRAAYTSFALSSAV